MYYVILNLGPKYRSGHPELLQLEKPMVTNSKSRSGVHPIEGNADFYLSENAETRKVDLLIFLYQYHFSILARCPSSD